MSCPLTLKRENGRGPQGVEEERKAGELSGASSKLQPNVSHWAQLYQQKKGQRVAKLDLLSRSFCRNTTRLWWGQHGGPPLAGRRSQGPSRQKPDPRICNAQEAEALEGV